LRQTASSAEQCHKFGSNPDASVNGANSQLTQGWLTESHILQAFWTLLTTGRSPTLFHNLTPGAALAPDQSWKGCFIGSTVSVPASRNTAQPSGLHR